MSDERKLLERARAKLKDCLEAFGPCDHGVGICNCDLSRCIAAIDRHLKEEPKLCMCEDRQKSECPGEWEPRRENRSRDAQAEVESERVRWMSSDGPLTTAMDNVLASRMGTACQAAMSMSAGDLIDRGLGLLLKLNESGFDVTYRAEPAAQTKDSKQ